MLDYIIGSVTTGGYVRLGEALKEYRNQHKLLQKEIADRLGITREYYALLEEGHRLPSPGLLYRISCQLEISMEFTIAPPVMIHEPTFLKTPFMESYPPPCTSPYL